MIVPRLYIGEGLENGERCLGVACREPGTGVWFLVDAGVDVAEEGLQEVFFAGFGDEVDVLRVG